MPNNNPFSAAPSVIGYLFQCRYALLDSLRRLREGKEFSVSLETLDDVVFESDGEPIDLLQTKHHLNRSTNLTDSSAELWKTLRIWCEGIIDRNIPPDSNLFLITTAVAPIGSISSYLKMDQYRNPNKALERLKSIVETSLNQNNTTAYTAFRKLNEEEKVALINSITVIDATPLIAEVDRAFREVVFFAVEQQFIDSYLQRIEGWWFRKAIIHLTSNNAQPILSEEILSETNRLREQFKQDSLPIDDDIIMATVDSLGYDDRLFVHQLRLIEIGNKRIFHAIRNYFRAFEQRSRWVREDLLMVGELSRYEDRLVEEWDIYFQQMHDELGTDATDDAKKTAAQAVYKWAETSAHPSIRVGVSDPCIARGTYHILADSQQVGWHPEFAERLKNLLEI